MKHAGNSTSCCEIARTTYVPAALIAGIYIALDDIERALEYLERGVEERAITLLWLPFERYWDRLHGDPRFTQAAGEHRT